MAMQKFLQFSRSSFFGFKQDNFNIAVIVRKLKLAKVLSLLFLDFIKIIQCFILKFEKSLTSFMVILQ